MKKIPVMLFVCLLGMPAQAAVDYMNCNTLARCREVFATGNVDLDRVLEYRVQFGWSYAENFDIVSYLVDNGARAGRDKWDALYSRYLSDVCNGASNNSTHNNQKNMFNALNNGADVTFSRLKYNPDTGLRFFLDVSAFSANPSDSQLSCVLESVAKYGRDKLSLLEYGLERAQTYGNTRMVDTINALRTEIEKQQTNAGAQ